MLGKVAVTADNVQCARSEHDEPRPGGFSARPYDDQKSAGACVLALVYDLIERVAVVVVRIRSELTRLTQLSQLSLIPFSFF